VSLSLSADANWRYSSLAAWPRAYNCLARYLPEGFKVPVRRATCCAIVCITASQDRRPSRRRRTSCGTRLATEVLRFWNKDTACCCWRCFSTLTTPVRCCRQTSAPHSSRKAKDVIAVSNQHYLGTFLRAVAYPVLVF
jgi:hypothetical protein